MGRQMVVSTVINILLKVKDNLAGVARSMVSAYQR